MHERKQIGCVNWKSNWILYILCCLSAVLTFEVTHNPMLHRTDLFITLFSILAILKHLVRLWMRVHETIICYLYCYFQLNQNTYLLRLWYLFQFWGYDLSTSVSTSCVFLRLRQRLPIRIYDFKMTDKMERWESVLHFLTDSPQIYYTL